MTGPYAAVLATAMLNLVIIIILGEVNAQRADFFSRFRPLWMRNPR